MLKIIAITPERPYGCEAEAICRMVDAGIWRVHVRRPGATDDGMRRLLERLPAEVLPQVTLHDCLGVAAEFGAGGVHLNGRNPEPPAGFGGRVSRSCHTLAEAGRCTQEDYLFLSPLFDSISKRGYAAGFTADELQQAAAAGAIGPRLFALGGVTPERLPQVAAWGFGGAALLGYVWGDGTMKEIEKRLKRIACYNS